MTAPPRYIHIRNWRDFQHYSSKNVPWIKDYVAQLSDDDYLDLTFHQRGILHGLRLEYARTAHRHARGGAPAQPRGLRDSTVALSRRLGQRVTMRDLDALNDAGLILFSSRQILEPVKIESTPEEETEREEEKNKTKTEVQGDALNVTHLDDFRADHGLEPIETFRIERKVRKSKAELILEAGRGEHR